MIYEPRTEAERTAWDDGYRRGYEDGESSQLADWFFAFEDIVPDDFEHFGPHAVAVHLRERLGLGKR